MRSWIPLATLLAVVIALGAWVYHTPASDKVDTHALSALKPKDVKRVRLVTTAVPSANTIVLEQKNGDWRLTAPFAARAENFQVERLLAILEARSTARYPARDLARYGLDTPVTTVTLEDQTFAYGAINKMTREQYVLTANEIYPVPLAYSTGLPRNVDALLARQVLARNEAPSRFELPDFSVSLHDGTWTVAPASNDVGADERIAWVDAWRNASAIRAARNDGAAASQDIKVGLKDGRTIAIGIVQRESELVLVRRDEGVEYHFFGDSAKRLLLPPGTTRQKSELPAK